MIPARESFGWRVDGKVATITLDRPERKNPLTFDSYAELIETFRALVNEKDIRAVVPASFQRDIEGKAHSAQQRQNLGCASAGDDVTGGRTLRPMQATAHLVTKHACRDTEKAATSMIEEFDDVRIWNSLKDSDRPFHQIGRDVDVVLHDQSRIEIALEKNGDASDMAAVAAIFAREERSPAVPSKAFPINVPKILL